MTRLGRFLADVFGSIRRLITKRRLLTITADMRGPSAVTRQWR